MFPPRFMFIIVCWQQFGCQGSELFDQVSLFNNSKLIMHGVLFIEVG